MKRNVIRLTDGVWLEQGRQGMCTEFFWAKHLASDFLEYRRGDKNKTLH
jgi:hypothetical protein